MIKKNKNFVMWHLLLSVCLSIGVISNTFAAIYNGNPANYRALLNNLVAGDTLILDSGTYTQGMTISNTHGTAKEPIVITGPESGDPAIILGRSCFNTVQIQNSSYLEVHHLTLDGQNFEADGVNGRGTTHHITINNLHIINHGVNQLIVGINTKGPAWNWVIKNNTIDGAGTGIYLGGSSGNWAFVNGLIEHNLIVDTLGYSMQIKHQISRETGIGMPQTDSRTIIRHNVFSKANNASSGRLARPNLLVGHFPLSGVGSNDLYEIYGNFLHQNPSEALFQGEGNIAMYNNVLLNDVGSALNIQPHNDVPKRIDIFRNTIVASGSGIRVRGGHPDYDQKVFANAVFAGGNPIINADDQTENITDDYNAAASYLVAPRAALGKLDLYPLRGKTTGSTFEFTQNFTDSSLDFDGRLMRNTDRGAYVDDETGSVWLPQLQIKPVDPTPVSPSIVTQPEDVTVTEGEDATFSVVATGSGLLEYQWFHNDVEIDGATNSSYTINAVSTSNNDRYRCKVYNDQGFVNSEDAVLTVSIDDVAPTLLSAFATRDIRVDIVFSEPVSARSAETIGNYQITPSVDITSASLSDDKRIVSLIVSQLLEDTDYSVQVSNVQDLAQTPNTLAQSSINFTYRSADGFEDGNADGWEPYNDNGNTVRWSVVEDEGDMAYYLNTTKFDNLSGNRLGEYSLLPEKYGDFTFTAQAKLGDDVTVNSLADYAVVFGFEDSENYYFVMFNNRADATQLFKVINGSRTALSTNDVDWLKDNEYHHIEISRVGSEIKVYFDGDLMWNVVDDSLGVGQVGIGSYNDSAYFDDVSVTGESSISDPGNSAVPTSPTGVNLLRR
ncbi:hypothetical protein MNBD_GAMMA16-119 [hydrothermal vent metagenome]|uniref:Ig-like domain-containing protein n=1 Tax=hydrothermal vent metagenome TaxID=652676 RepID=A0A3B0Z0W7_9ZZZZ